MLEAKIAEQYVDQYFVLNGILDKQVTPKDPQVDFYIQNLNENIYIGSAQLDKNNTFSFINTTDIKAGVYDMVAAVESNLGEDIFSEPIYLSINPEMKTVPLSLNSFAGTNFTDSQTEFGAGTNPFQKQKDTSQIISGVTVEPGQPINLDLGVVGELSQVTVNFNSVLYSATAIASSTNSELQIDAPLELGFEPGTTHTATAYAESLEDPTRKSKAIIIEFTIADTTAWYLDIYFILTILLLATGSGIYFYQSQRQSA